MLRDAYKQNKTEDIKEQIILKKFFFKNDF